MGVVRLTATLASSIAISEELHLDGLLESAHPVARQRPMSRSTPLTNLPMPPLPICAHTLDGARARLASSAQFPDEAREHGSPIVKRRDGEDIESLARPIHLGLGPGKNRMHRVTTVVTPWIRWLAIGDRREIMRLARRIQQIGQWRSAGYGQVLSWQAEALDLDPVSVLVDHSIAQRHLPAAWCQWAESTVEGPYRPPYWHPERQSDLIVRAGTRCVLKPSVEEACRAVAHPDALRAHKERKIRRARARSAGAYPTHGSTGGSGAADPLRLARAMREAGGVVQRGQGLDGAAAADDAH